MLLHGEGALTSPYIRVGYEGLGWVKQPHASINFWTVKCTIKFSSSKLSAHMLIVENIVVLRADESVTILKHFHM
jgi:hypothetical protein